MRRGSFRHQARVDTEYCIKQGGTAEESNGNRLLSRQLFIQKAAGMQKTIFVCRFSMKGVFCNVKRNPIQNLSGRIRNAETVVQCTC